MQDSYIFITFEAISWHLMESAAKKHLRVKAVPISGENTNSQVAEEEDQMGPLRNLCI